MAPRLTAMNGPAPRGSASLSIELKEKVLHFDWVRREARTAGVPTGRKRTVGRSGLEAAVEVFGSASSRGPRRELVKRPTHGTARLGDLIAAAFDEAARYSADPREVSRLATQAVRHLMRRAGRMPVPLPAACA